ncbi:MAG: hypothetical protein JWN40_314 [Phycisphaerales bacterium]|nr:hypothetical protein [Phycisphaerales bacterium]
MDRTSLLWTQHRCMTYTPPADQIAYEQAKWLGDQLVAHDPAYRQSYSDVVARSGVWPLEGTFRVVDSWEHLDATIPLEKSTFRGQSYVLSRRYKPCATVFVHARHAPQCDDRLVIIELEGSRPDFNALVIRPGTLSRDPQVLWHKRLETPFGNMMQAPSLIRNGGNLGAQVFFGQPSSDDPAVFNIPACIDGVNVQIIGHLLPDDTVRIDIPNASQAGEQLMRPRPELPMEN